MRSRTATANPSKPKRTNQNAPQTQANAFGLSARARCSTQQPISYLMSEALRRPGVISLAAGFVDDETLPAASMRDVADDLLGSPTVARAALQYGTTQGHPSLREALYEHLARLDGAPASLYPGSPAQVVVGNGSQQLLHLLTDVLIDPGQIVITAWPSYFVYTNALETFAAEVRCVEMDERGIVPERLEATLDEIDQAGMLDRVKIVYLCPAHQNPTGRSLSASRRLEVLRIVRRYSEHGGQRILLIEDAAYRELTYAEPDGANLNICDQVSQGVDPGYSRTPGSIKQGDRHNEYVALLQTFSKSFAPGVKIGYGLLPDDLVEPVLAAKAGRDFGSSNLTQYLLDEAMRTGAYERHLAGLRQTYQRKRDTLLRALEEHLGQVEGIEWTMPNGGLYVWMTLPQSIDTGPDGPLFDAALDIGVLYVPGAYCFAADHTREAPRNTLRLSFGLPRVEQIHTGIERLASVIGSVIHR